MSNNIDEVNKKLGLKLKIENGQKKQTKISFDKFLKSFDIDKNIIFNCRDVVQERVRICKQKISETTGIPDNPYVVYSEKNKGYYIIDGRHMIEACIELGMREIDCFEYDENPDLDGMMFKFFRASYTFNNNEDMYPFEKILSVYVADRYMVSRYGKKYGKEKLDELGLVSVYQKLANRVLNNLIYLKQNPKTIFDEIRKMKFGEGDGSPPLYDGSFESQFKAKKASFYVEEKDIKRLKLDGGGISDIGQYCLLLEKQSMHIDRMYESYSMIVSDFTKNNDFNDIKKLFNESFEYLGKFHDLMNISVNKLVSNDSIIRLKDTDFLKQKTLFDFTNKKEEE